MINLKIFPRCCPTRHYTLLGLNILGNDSIWEIYECQECGHLVKKWLKWFNDIEEIQESKRVSKK